MNIKTANRLLTLRKKNGFSQEELAAKLGITRQAVSKWERAEASPDTDNLIELAKLYGVSLDELLQFHEKIAGKEKSELESEAETDAYSDAESDTEGSRPLEQETPPDDDQVTISNGGIDAEDKEGNKVHIGFDGIRFSENGNKDVNIDWKKGDKLHLGGDGVYFTNENGEKISCGHDHHSEDAKQKHWWRLFPYPVLSVILFFLWGFYLPGGWGVAWLIFLTIPLYYTLAEAIYKKNAVIFAYPVLCTIAFFVIGFVWGYWHPGWLVFLTIPIYYSITALFKPQQ